MKFRHERIDNRPPCGQLAFCLTDDLTGNGYPDVVVGGLGHTRLVDVPVLGKRLNLRGFPVTSTIVRKMESTVFWYENPGWKRHTISNPENLSVGGALGDITGDGRSDLVAGQNLGSELYWFEQPANPREEWTRYLITDEFVKYHDVTVADVDDDGEDEVVVLSQESETVFYYDIPADPRQSPWPADHRHVVDDDLNVEGVRVLDIDGDGRTELVAGANLFRRDPATDDWDREVIADGWEWTRVVTGDVDGDGADEVVISEGDLPYQDDRLGRVSIFDTLEWTETPLADDLSNPHTLQLADFDGNGHLDVLVAEMGLEMKDDPSFEPEMMIYRNDGEGSFEREVIEHGVPTHEAKAVDMTGNGRPDIVGKSYSPTTHVDIWYNEG